MNIEKFRKQCLSMPGATETVQWGNDLVFKVGGKRFAVAALDAAATHCVSFKCSDEGFAELQEFEGAVPASYLARAVSFNASKRIWIAGPSASTGMNSASPCIDRIDAAGMMPGKMP